MSDVSPAVFELVGGPYDGETRALPKCIESLRLITGYPDGVERESRYVLRIGEPGNKLFYEEE